MTGLSADDIIAQLGLAPHPEGGYFRETFRDEAHSENGRAHSTAIYYLLKRGEMSWWHRVDAAEIWHHYAGAPLELSIVQERAIVKSVLGKDFEKDQRPQITVPAQAWQSARPMGEWVLVGCTVAPGFEFSGFELADDDFSSSGFTG